MSRKYDMVIARYNETLEWLRNVDLTNIERVFIYNKNDEPYKLLFSIHPNVTIVDLPNVGRESHTYLYHIISHYDTIEKFSQKIIFVQGKFSDHIKFEELLRCDNFYESMSEQLNTFRLFYYKSRLRPNNLNKPAIEWAKTYIDPHISTWIKNNGFYVRYGACFCVDKRSILSRSYGSYITLISTIDDHANPEEGHFFERFWYYIFNMHIVNYDLPSENYILPCNSFYNIYDATYITTGYKYICSYQRIHVGELVKINFKTLSDAHIGLSDPTTKQIFEIVIGGWNNKNSCIRPSKQGRYIMFINSRYCDPDNFRTIYIKLTNKIIVYDSSMNIIMMSNNITNKSFTIYLSSWKNLSCIWKISK